MKAFWIGVAALGVVALAACKGSDSTGPGTSGINGAWKFQETLSNAALALTCADSATVTVTQSGQTFTATYAQTGTCNANGQTLDNSGSGSITNGSIVGDSVSFAEDICAYAGTMSGSPATSMTGTVTCTDTSSGTPVVVAGNWVMNR